jgi:hypothetical protein
MVLRLNTEALCKVPLANRIGPCQAPRSFYFHFRQAAAAVTGQKAESPQK